MHTLPYLAATVATALCTDGIKAHIQDGGPVYGAYCFIYCCIQGEAVTCHLADLLCRHDEVTLLCALRKDPAHLAQPARMVQPLVWLLS